MFQWLINLFKEKPYQICHNLYGDHCWDKDKSYHCPIRAVKRAEVLAEDKPPECSVRVMHNGIIWKEF